jgi:hypothetical protein
VSLERAHLIFWTTLAYSLASTFVEERAGERRFDETHPSPRLAGRGNVFGRAKSIVQ